MARCSRCGFHNLTVARFCNQCGMQIIARPAYRLPVVNAPDPFKWAWRKFNGLTLAGKASLVVIASLTLLAFAALAAMMGKTNHPRLEGQPTAKIAQSDAWKPSEACDFLAHIYGLQTRGYKQFDGYTYTCLSSYKELNIGPPLPNNIAYYAEGDADNVFRLRLVLNVNDYGGVQKAHAALLQYSDELTRKALNLPMPKEAKSAITSGRAGQWQIGKAEAKVVLEMYPTGRGYELRYVLRK
jgi:hypothetical protein